MQLKFYAREDALVREAGVHPRVGEATRYYGRTFDSVARAYPATKEPFAVDSESEDGQKCSKQCRKGALWAADKATAEAIGVELVEVVFDNGAHVAKPKSEKKPPSGGKGEG